MSEATYKQLVREEVRSNDDNTSGGTRKRRRKNIPAEARDVTDSAATDTIVVDDDNASDSWDSDEFEDVDIPDKTGDDEREDEYSEDGYGEQTEEGMNYNFDELEKASTEEDSITVVVRGPEEAKPSKKRKFVPISKEERDTRRQIHQMYIAIMICHGVIRNRWCNDHSLLMNLRKFVPSRIISLVNQVHDSTILDLVKSRRFLDGIQLLLSMYSSRFKVTTKGLIRKNWNELSIPQMNTEKNVTFDKFQRLVLNFKGSRDVGAQGFVALLRSIGLNARLIFSLQPPDYTLVSALPKITTETIGTKSASKPTKNALLERFRHSNDTRLKFLNKVRSQPVTQQTEDKAIEESQYPIFWVEVWNKYSKKWVSIDPMVLKLLEQVPMRRKSKFEPPLSDTTNQAVYIIAFDKLGGVKDVTRRYCQYFNARTAKKRIGSRSDEDSYWYTRLLRCSNSSLKKDIISNVDILESKEFHNRDLGEGIPNNIADFKNHPIYALESQLRQNEVIYPQDSSSKAGTFRHRGKLRVIPIYKRSHVYLLRSARAWYMRGRVLKVAEQALKEKRKSGVQEDADDEDDEVTRLYAEFQTKLYHPPPIVNGVVPKNAYGNIDVYTPNMMPENGVLIPTTGKYTMKMAERAARYILEIDYARAVIAFDFGGQGGGRNRGGGRKPTTKEGGIVIDIQYQEAMKLVLDCLVDEEEEKKNQMVEMNALRNWKFFLTKLRITDRLNKQHGVIKTVTKKNGEGDEEDEEEDFSVHDESSGDDQFSVHDESSDDFEQGGFFMGEDSGAYTEENEKVQGSTYSDKKAGKEEHEHSNKHSSRRTTERILPIEENFDENEGGFILEDIESGGFIPEDAENPEDTENEGGFILEDTENPEDTDDKGGFMPEDTEYQAELMPEEDETAGGFLPENEEGDFLETEFTAILENTEADSKAPYYSAGGEIIEVDDVESDGIEELPDRFFREDEAGELIYDPETLRQTTMLETAADSAQMENSRTGLKMAATEPDTEIIEQLPITASPEEGAGAGTGAKPESEPQPEAEAEPHIEPEQEPEEDEVVAESSHEPANDEEMAKIRQEEEDLGITYSDDSEW